MTEEQATEKQIKFMKQLGIFEGVHGISKQKARNAIQDKLKDDEDGIEREPVKAGEQAENKAVYDKFKVKANPYEEENYQVKSRQCRFWSLDIAERYFGDKGSSEAIISLAKEFEKYIRFGE